MIDTFSCIPFDLPHLIFKVELAISLHFFLKSFYSSLKKPMPPATAARFFTLTSHSHKMTLFSIFMMSSAVKNVTTT